MSYFGLPKDSVPSARDRHWRTARHRPRRLAAPPIRFPPHIPSLAATYHMFSSGSVPPSGSGNGFFMVAPGCNAAAADSAAASA